MKRFKVEGDFRVAGKGYITVNAESEEEAVKKAKEIQLLGGVIDFSIRSVCEFDPDEKVEDMRKEFRR